MLLNRSLGPRAALAQAVGLSQLCNLGHWGQDRHRRSAPATISEQRSLAYPPQQPDETEPAHETGDHANWQSLRGHQDAGNKVPQISTIAPSSADSGSSRGDHGAGACWLHLTVSPFPPPRLRKPVGTIVRRDAMLRPRRAWRDLHTTSVVTGAFESFAYRCLPRPYWAASLKNGEAGVIQTINRRRGKPPKDGRSQDGTGARPNHSAQTPLHRNAKRAGLSPCGSEEKHVLMSDYEIITDGGRRRRWSSAEKHRIAEEALVLALDQSDR